MSDKIIYIKDTLTGGGATAMDGIAGSLLSNGDIAFVMLATGMIGIYKLNATSGQAESSPLIIVPDTPAGTEAWILQGIVNQTVHLLDTDQSHDLIVQCGEDLSADRILSIIVGNAARSLTIGADIALYASMGRTLASDPKDATPGNRPAGTLKEIGYYNGKYYFCTNASTPTWEIFTSS